MKLTLLIIVLLIAGAFALRPKTVLPSTNGTPTPAIRLTKTTETSVDNPDGTRTLRMRTQRLSGTNTIYTFIVAEGVSERTIFTQTAEAGTSFTIPANTWSPGENTYVFLAEKSTVGTRFLVLKASGLAFGDEEQYVDVNALFAKTPNKYQIRDVTGWDSPQLLHVVTVTDEGGKGPSFWFDVGNRVFLQLAS